MLLYRRESTAKKLTRSQFKQICFFRARLTGFLLYVINRKTLFEAPVKRLFDGLQKFQ